MITRRGLLKRLAAVAAVPVVAEVLSGADVGRCLPVYATGGVIEVGDITMLDGTAPIGIARHAAKAGEPVLIQLDGVYKLGS